MAVRHENVLNMADNGHVFGQSSLEEECACAADLVVGIGDDQNCVNIGSRTQVFASFVPSAGFDGTDSFQVGVAFVVVTFSQGSYVIAFREFLRYGWIDCNGKEWYVYWHMRIGRLLVMLSWDIVDACFLGLLSGL